MPQTGVLAWEAPGRGSKRASVRPEGRWSSSVRQVQNFTAQERLGHLRLATVLLFAVCGLAFTSTEALAASPTTGDRATAPSPDPKPPPKPDPKPPQPPPPPPPPPPPARKARAEKPKSAVTATRPTATRPAAARPKALRRKAPARVVAPRARPRPKVQRPKRKVERVTKVRHEPRRVRRKQAEVQKASRSARAALARETPNLDAAPLPVFPRPEPLLSSAALPVAVPMVGLGLALLLGASLVSALRVPRPGVAERVYARRLDLAAFGFGAIALALLWLNVTVLF